MTPEKQQVQFTRTIQTTPAEVYYAFTQAIAWQQWGCDTAQIDPRPDGYLYIGAGDYCAYGKYTALEEDKTVAFTWNGLGEPPNLVEVALAAEGDGVQMILTVTNRGTVEAWEAAETGLIRAWAHALDSLQAMLETGYSTPQRPILGVLNGQDLTPELAGQWNVPVTEGFQIFTPLDGMGAQAAGLQQDDVIVELDGYPISGAAALGAVLDMHAPGDRVDVVFYRGAARQTTSMELSTRPRPDVPTTPAGLAAAMRENYTQQDSLLTELLSGVPESQLTWTPNAIRWSAKHVIAHLLTTERAVHMWLARRMAGLTTDEWASQNETWVRAIADSYPTTADAVAALKQAEIETLRMLATLPEDFVAHKGTYLVTSMNILQGLPYHTHLHLDQMRKVLAEAAQA